MESLHGKLVEVVLLPAFTTVGTVMTINYLTLDIVGRLPRNLAIAAQIAEVTAAHAFLMSCLMTIVMKYVSIYHGTRVSTLNESRVITYLRRVLLSIPLTLTALDYLVFIDIDKSPTFQAKVHGSVKEDQSNIEACKMTLMGLTTLAFARHSGKNRDGSLQVWRLPIQLDPLCQGDLGSIWKPSHAIVGSS